MKRISKGCAIVSKGPPGSPDSGNVVTRGIEGNIWDTNNGGSTEACKGSLGRGSKASKEKDGNMGMSELEEQDEGRIEVEDDKRSSWSRNLGKSTIDKYRQAARSRRTRRRS